MKKNDDTKNAELELLLSIHQKLNKLPALTEPELEELMDKSEKFGSEMEDKGCWLGLGMFRSETGKPKKLVQAEGFVGGIALMVAEAMDSEPVLARAFELAMFMRLAAKYDADKAEAEDDDMTDAAEAEEDGQAPGCELGEC